MIEDVFLTYANLRISEEPETLYKVLDSAERNIKMSKIFAEDLRKTVEYIIDFSGYDDPKIVRKIVSKIKFKVDKELEKLPPETARIDRIALVREKRCSWPAFDAVFGLRENFCSGCFPIHYFVLDYPDLLEVELGKTKCYGCFHALTRHLLSEITKGKEYSKIPSLENFIISSGRLQRGTWVVPSPPGSLFKETLYETVMWHSGLIYERVFPKS